MHLYKGGDIMKGWIKGACHTNLDDFNREKWPTVFAGIPAKGERVRSESGKELYVVGIVHSQKDSNYRLEPEPFLYIELHRG